MIPTVQAGDVYAGFTYRTDSNKGICFDSSPTSTSKDIESYLWDFGDGHKSNESDPCHNYDFWQPNRDYIVSLTITDEDGVQNSHYRRITAYNTNLYLAFGILLIVGLLFIGSQYKISKRRSNHRN